MQCREKSPLRGAPGRAVPLWHWLVESHCLRRKTGHLRREGGFSSLSGSRIDQLKRKKSLFTIKPQAYFLAFQYNIEPLPGDSGTMKDC